MTNKFQCAETFNGKITDWNLSKATSMLRMFASAKKFNGDLSSWTKTLVKQEGDKKGEIPNINGIFKGSLITEKRVETWGWKAKMSSTDLESMWK